MAKEDFCFTYYDGDAARDMSHMNRLERGAYGDLVMSQRKFGWLTLDQIKKTLGKDFDEVWPAISLIMVFSELEKKYYIDWLHKSIEKMRAHSKKQSQNVTKRYQQPTKDLPKEPMVTPLEDGNGDGDGDSSVLKIIKEPEKKDSRETIELRLSEVFTDAHRENLIFAYRDVDVDEQWPKFQVKVRGSPDFYALHSSEGLRMAFQRHLENAQRKKRNNHKGITATQQEDFDKL